MSRILWRLAIIAVATIFLGFGHASEVDVLDAEQAFDDDLLNVANSSFNNTNSTNATPATVSPTANPTTMPTRYNHGPSYSRFKYLKFQQQFVQTKHRAVQTQLWTAANRCMRLENRRELRGLKQSVHALRRGQAGKAVPEKYKVLEDQVFEAVENMIRVAQASDVFGGFDPVSGKKPIRTVDVDPNRFAVPTESTLARKLLAKSQPQEGGLLRASGANVASEDKFVWHQSNAIMQLCASSTCSSSLDVTNDVMTAPAPVAQGDTLFYDSSAKYEFSSSSSRFLGATLHKFPKDKVVVGTGVTVTACCPSEICVVFDQNSAGSWYDKVKSSSVLAKEGWIKDPESVTVKDGTTSDDYAVYCQNVSYAVPTNPFYNHGPAVIGGALSLPLTTTSKMQMGVIVKTAKSKAPTAAPSYPPSSAPSMRYVTPAPSTAAPSTPAPTRVHLSEQGANGCDYGVPVNQSACLDAALMSMPAIKKYTRTTPTTVIVSKQPGLPSGCSVYTREPPTLAPTTFPAIHLLEQMFPKGPNGPKTKNLTEPDTKTNTTEPTSSPTFVPTSMPTHVPTTNQQGPEHVPYTVFYNPVAHAMNNGDYAPVCTHLASTEQPTFRPTPAPSISPTLSPTMSPTHAPTDAPTDAPTGAPTDAPTIGPTIGPTMYPTPDYLSPDRVQERDAKVAKAKDIAQARKQKLAREHKKLLEIKEKKWDRERADLRVLNRTVQHEKEQVLAKMAQTIRLQNMCNSEHSIINATLLRQDLEEIRLPPSAQAAAVTKVNLLKSIMKIVQKLGRLHELNRVHAMYSMKKMAFRLLQATSELRDHGHWTSIDPSALDSYTQHPTAAPTTLDQLLMSNPKDFSSSANVYEDNLK